MQTPTIHPTQKNITNIKTSIATSNIDRGLGQRHPVCNGAIYISVSCVYKSFYPSSKRLPQKSLLHRLMIFKIYPAYQNFLINFRHLILNANPIHLFSPFRLSSKDQYRFLVFRTLLFFPHIFSLIRLLQ